MSRGMVCLGMFLLHKNLLLLNTQVQFCVTGWIAWEFASPLQWRRKSFCTLLLFIKVHKEKHFVWAAIYLPTYPTPLGIIKVRYLWKAAKFLFPKSLNSVFEPPGSVIIYIDPDPALGVRILKSSSENKLRKTLISAVLGLLNLYVNCYLEDWCKIYRRRVQWKI